MVRVIPRIFRPNIVINGWEVCTGVHCITNLRGCLPEGVCNRGGFFVQACAALRRKEEAHVAWAHRKPVVLLDLDRSDAPKAPALTCLLCMRFRALWEVLARKLDSMGWRSSHCSESHQNRNSFLGPFCAFSCCAPFASGARRGEFEAILACPSQKTDLWMKTMNRSQWEF